MSSLPPTPTQQTWLPTGRLNHSSPNSQLPFHCLCLLSLLLWPSFLFVDSYPREAHSHPEVSVSESCQRAEGLSKQGESHPHPSPPVIQLFNVEQYIRHPVVKQPRCRKRWSGHSLHTCSMSVSMMLTNVSSLQDPKERLGCQVQTGFTDIKSHTFFRNIDWDQVRTKSLRGFFLLYRCIFRVKRPT